MSKIVEKIFKEIVKEARSGEVKYKENVYGTLYDCVFRMKFNGVEDNKVDNMYNLYISDYKEFIQKLDEYVYSTLELYNLDRNEYVIKKVITLLWSNITNNEMLNINEYVSKYISFIRNNQLLNQHGSKHLDEIGLLNYYFSTQSCKQETPYCFNAYFSNNDINYYLPRISFGIMNGKCYIYAIQNKEKNDKSNEQIVYGDIIRKKINTLNSGIKKHRNVTPSALVS